jgi:hypothetical protein
MWSYLTACRVLDGTCVEKEKVTLPSTNSTRVRVLTALCFELSKIETKSDSPPPSPVSFSLFGGGRRGRGKSESPSFSKGKGKKKEQKFVVRASNLVDPASSHTLVSKIKPCMSKYKQLYTVKLRMAHYISYSLFDSTLLLG